MGDENLDDESKIETDDITEGVSVETLEDDSATTDGIAAPEFDPVALEATFGLETGALKDCADDAEAFKIIREHTDKVLQAGLGLAEKPATPATPAPKPRAPKEPTVSDLQKEVEAVKKQLADQAAALQTSAAREVEHRLSTAIDGFKSPKYGVTGARNYQQAKATRDFKNMVSEFVQGLVSSGQQVIPIESIALRLQAVDDADNFDARHKKGAKAKAATQQPVGTPGNQKGGAGDPKAPRNIHEAMLQGKRFVGPN